MEMGGIGFGTRLRRGVRPIGNDVGSIDGGICEDRIGVGPGEFELSGDKGKVGVEESMIEDGNDRWWIQSERRRRETAKIATNSFSPGMR